VRSALVLLALAVAGVAAGRGVVLVLDVRAGPAAGPATAPATGPATGATASSAAAVVRVGRGARLLDEWDEDRAAAFARGDERALRSLYVRGSRAGRRDVRVLEAYARRGLVVRGLHTQVLALRVRSRDDHRVVLQVTDRVVGARAVSRHAPHRGVPLPQDAPSTRVVTLEHSGGGWRVVSVRDR
jgi:hypothetical protein